MSRQFTAIIEKEEGGYVSLCPQLDIASQGDTVAQARMNLQEALELFFETASTEEITQWLHGDTPFRALTASHSNPIHHTIWQFEENPRWGPEDFESNRVSSRLTGPLDNAITNECRTPIDISG